MAQFVKAAALSEIPSGQGTTVEIDGRMIALFSVEGSFYAMDNTCLHRGGPLGEGYLEAKIVTCPWHGWRFDVTTGASEVNPEAHLATYPVKIEGQDIYVEI